MKRRVGKVTAELRLQILSRDKACLLSKIEPDHVCRNLWGTPHAPNDLNQLSLEHVHDGGGMMGKRAPSDAAHLVALCAFSNVSVPNKSQRAYFRSYLSVLYAKTAP